jgi:hypothetical protein
MVRVNYTNVMTGEQMVSRCVGHGLMFSSPSIGQGLNVEESTL